MRQTGMEINNTRYIKRRIRMEKDRTAICNIISTMLDNPDKHGIYSTSTAYARLEHYIEGIRAEASRKFVNHIQDHLEPGQEVMCKICNRTMRDITRQ